MRVVLVPCPHLSKSQILANIQMPSIRSCNQGCHSNVWLRQIQVRLGLHTGGANHLQLPKSKVNVTQWFREQLANAQYANVIPEQSGNLGSEFIDF